jgi:hypothetical protein
MDNELVAQGQDEITYDAQDGNYKGLVEILPKTFNSGKYYIKVKTDYHLKRQIPSILTLNAGQTNTAPAATLVTGDANNDNQLSILDYNSLLSCYSDLVAAHESCSNDLKLSTDFNDDTHVNQIDYNLFLREIATQPGE